MPEICKKCRKAGDLKICSRCKGVSYCSRECQVADWRSHKPRCKEIPSTASSNITTTPTATDRSNQDGKEEQTDGKEVPTRASATSDPDALIHGVELRPRLENNQTSVARVPWQCTSDHPIFTRGELCPLTVLYGIPIIIFSKGIHGPWKGGRNQEPKLNQPAVYLRIEADNGFAPANWQIQSPDHCYIVRRDKQPLTTEVVQTMHAFHSELLGSDYFEKHFEGLPPPYTISITPAVYENFSKQYWDQQKQYGRQLQNRGDGR